MSKKSKKSDGFGPEFSTPFNPNPPGARVAEYRAAIESAEASGGSILDVDPTEFGLPEDMDDGERYFAHVMSKDD